MVFQEQAGETCLAEYNTIYCTLIFRVTAVKLVQLRYRKIVRSISSNITKGSILMLVRQTIQLGSSKISALNLTEELLVLPRAKCLV